MRSLLALASSALFLALAAAGCETQSLLARCENQTDCDHSTAPVNHCVQFANPAAECAGQGGVQDCICCPITIDSTTDMHVAAVCNMGSAPVDVAPTDAVVTDTGPRPCAPACSPGVTYCNDGTCEALRSLGSMCAADTECFGGHCSGERVCCQVACTASGYSCTVPGLEGICVAIASMDAGRDSSTDDVATSTDVATDSAPADASTPLDAATKDAADQ